MAFEVKKRNEIGKSKFNKKILGFKCLLEIIFL